MQNLLAVLGFAVLILLWALIYFYLMRVLVLALKSKSWPITEGKITHSEMKSAKYLGSSYAANKYRVLFQYVYTVNGVAYASQLLSFGDLALYQVSNNGLRSKEAAEYIVTKYPVGRIVNVHYDPRLHRRATVVPGVNTNLALLMAIFSVIGLFILAVLFLVR